MQIDNDSFCCIQNLDYNLDLSALTTVFAIISTRFYIVESTISETTDTEIENINQTNIKIENIKISSYNSLQIFNSISDIFLYSVSDISVSICGYYLSVLKINKFAISISYSIYQNQQIALYQLDWKFFYLSDNISLTTICFNYMQRLFTILDIYTIKKLYQQLTDYLINIYQYLDNWNIYHKEYTR